MREKEVKAEAPDHLLLQWHITERCNLACTHCYQEPSTPPDLDGPTLLRILDQFRALQDRFRAQRHGRRSRFHISVTGGEPLVRPDAMTLFEALAAERDRWSFAILCNGTLIDDILACHLARLRPYFVQVSIDGSECTHDSIRGAGAFARAVDGIRRLVRRRVPVLIAFTAAQHNYLEFSEVAQLGRRLGVRQVWADRMVPLGRGSTEGVLDPAQTRDWIASMQCAASATRSWPRRRTAVALHRALQFTAGGGTPYACSAGRTLLTVMTNGDVCPCRRMPVVAGNVLLEPLDRIYWESPVLQRLRPPVDLSKDCKACFYAKTCAGGLRCLAAAVHGDPFAGDPGCWLRKTAPHDTPMDSKGLSDAHSTGGKGYGAVF